MNRLPKLLVVALLLVVKAQSTFGQERTVTAKKLEDLKTRAYSALKKTPYREQQSFEQFFGQNLAPIDAWRLTVDFLDSNTRREILVGKFKNRYSGAVTSRIERVYKDKRKFVKSDDGPWKVDPSVEAPVRGSDLESLYAKEPKVVSEYKYKGKENINGVPTDLYEVTWTYFVSEQPHVYTGRFWFDKKGRFRKMEYETNRRDRGYSYHDVREFEYDTRITIKAPIK